MLLLLLVAVLPAACTGGTESTTGPQGDGDPVDGGATTGGTAGATGSTSPRDVHRPTVNLAVTEWTAARLNAAIAEHLIELRLGYPVEAVPVRDVGTMLDDLGSGDLDAVLELWPSTLEEAEQALIDSGAVAELGPLGVEAKVGWFVPRYVVEGELAVDHWERLADPAVARAFATPSTGSQGRFLGIDPDYYAELDEGLIDSLGLPFVVEYSGSEEASAAEVGTAVTAERPILLYWWTPTALVAGHDLVNVALPERTADCVADIEAGAPARCDYTVDRLIKLASPDLATKAPEVDRFLRAFELTTEDQLDLLDRVENRGQTIDQAVGAWVSANRDRWGAWLTS